MEYLDKTGFRYFWENKVKPISNKADAAQNKANEALEALKWKYAGEATGQTTVTLDSRWKEVHVVVLINSAASSCVSFNVLKDEIENIIKSSENTYAFYRQGYYYLASNNSGTTMRFGLNDVYMHQVVANGVDVTAASIWRVYWR